MKKRNVFLAAVAMMSLAACTCVTPGNVGIQVNQYGSDAGVDNESKPVGTYMTVFSSIYEYPVSTKNYVWTHTISEGHPANEEITFSDKSGVIVTADVGVAYHVDAANAPKLYQKYRMDMDELISGAVRTSVRNAISVESAKMAVEDIYGGGKTELLNKAFIDVQKQFAVSGLIIESLNWASPPRLPQNIQDQINNRVANEAAAAASVANLAKIEADGKSRVAKATADAEAMDKEGAAMRANPEILKQQWIQKWDGHLPQYVAGNAQNIIQLPQ